MYWGAKIGNNIVSQGVLFSRMFTSIVSRTVGVAWRNYCFIFVFVTVAKFTEIDRVGVPRSWIIAFILFMVVTH